MTLDARNVPADATSTEVLAAEQLDYRTLAVDDSEALANFIRADNRGFLDAEPGVEEIAAASAVFQERRNVAVYDGAELPVATLNSWVTPMTVPGGELDMWAISSVTVAATHRRRGIARALLEGELRAAASTGVPIVGLTASEATIYGRFGFAPALPVASISVDTRRAGWRKATERGRTEYVAREELAVHLGDLHERVRTRRVGMIPAWEGRWTQAAGLIPGDKQEKDVRGVRYIDEHGVTQGVLCYKLKGDPAAFDRFVLTVRYLIGHTEAATRALWGFAISHDLVTTVKADLRPVDDPLPWLVANPRAVDVHVHDHGWLRILDVPRVLESRTYAAELDLVLSVDDALGFTTGTYRLRVSGNGQATVEAAAGAADVELSVASLSAIVLGGVSATQLRAAGLIHATAEHTEALNAALRCDRAPVLSIWY